MNQKYNLSNFTKSESRAISTIRTVAMFLIILCHYAPTFLGSSALGALFSIGVPVFFIISGYLYGKKDIKNIKNWYIKQFIKISIPVYIYCIIVGIILLVFNNLGTITFKNIIIHIFLLQGFVNTNLGNIFTGNLWFISFILLSYLITPILQKIREKSISFKYILLFIMFFSIIEIFAILNLKLQAFSVSIPFIFLYIFFYFYSAYNKKMTSKKYIILSIGMSLSVICRFYFKYLADTRGMFYSTIYDRVIVQYTSLILAAWIFFTIYLLCQKFNILIDKLYSFINLCDKYSFYIYICHQMFLTGVCNVKGVTDNFALDTLIFIAATLFSAIILKFISEFLIKITTKVGVRHD